MAETRLSVHVYYRQCQTLRFLRATAVPAGTAEARISYEILSVCLSVCHDPVVYQAQVR